MKIKQCQKCGEDKQTSEFSPHGRTRDGYNKKCMACMAEERGMTEDEYFWHYLTHLAVKHNYDIAHSEENTQKTKEWGNKHPEKRAIYNKTYQQNNPVITRENARKNTARRKQRILAFTLNDLTEHDWRTLKEQFNNSCAYCGCSECKLTMDHIIPVSRGGQHTKENIVPACRSCNSRKSTKTPEEAGMEILGSI